MDRLVSKEEEVTSKVRGTASPAKLSPCVSEVPSLQPKLSQAGLPVGSVLRRWQIACASFRLEMVSKAMTSKSRSWTICTYKYCCFPVSAADVVCASPLPRQTLGCG